MRSGFRLVCLFQPPWTGSEKSEAVITAPSHSNSHFHGWKILCLSTFSMFVSVGFSTYLVGIYLESFSLAFDATPGQIGWATTILVLMQAGLGPILGHAVDAGKGRLILTSGAVMLSSGLLLLSQVSTLLQAGLVCVTLIATGAGMVGIVPAMSMVVQWFSRRRGLAVGIAACGLSFGGVIVPPVAAWLIESLGWRGSLMALGAFIGVFLVPAAWLMAVSKPADIGQYPDGDVACPQEDGPQSGESTLRFAELIRRRSFWLMAVSIGTMTFSGLLMITYLAPFARERGLGLQESAWILSVYAICGIAANFLSGWLCDRFHASAVLFSVLTTVAIGWGFMLYMDGVVALLISACLLGISLGSLVPVWTSLIALEFGPSAFGRVKGYMSLVLLGINVLPGPLAGYFHDSFGTYASAFALLWWVVPVGIASALMLGYTSSQAAIRK